MFIAAYLLKTFAAVSFLPLLMSVAAVVVFLLSFKDIKSLNKKMISLLLLSSGFFIWPDLQRFDWLAAITENAGIATLLLTAPMLGAILHYEPYEIVLLSLADRYIRTNQVFYTLTLGLVAFLCVLMNLAAVPFAYQLISPIAARYPDRAFYQAITRGFAVNMFWAPNLICVAVVLQYVPISWQELVPAGMCFAVLSFFAACLAGSFDAPSGAQRSPQAVKPGPSRLSDGYYASLLLVQVATILGVLTVLIKYAKVNIYVTVAIIALGMPLLFALFLGKLAVFWQSLRHYLMHTLPGMSNEFVLFISIGFFGYSLANSPFISVLQSGLSGLNGVSPAILVLVIIGAVAGFAFTGIHPIITISSLAIAFGKMNMELSGLQLAVSLLTGYIVYLLVSPFSSMVMIMSGLTGKSVYAMGLGLNGRYAVVLTLLTAVSIYIWRLL